jgi:hypothetical protein
MPDVTMLVTSLDGVVHLVRDGVIAGCDAGRYAAVCGAIFTPAAMTEPDGVDTCPLCHAQRRPPRRRGRKKGR